MIRTPPPSTPPTRLPQGRPPAQLLESSLPARLPERRLPARLPTISRGRPLAIGCVLAVLAHALILGGLHWSWRQEAVTPGAVEPFTVRALPLVAEVTTVVAAAPPIAGIVSQAQPHPQPQPQAQPRPRPAPPDVSARVRSMSSRPHPIAQAQLHLSPVEPAAAPSESAEPAGVASAAAAQMTVEPPLRPDPSAAAAVAVATAATVATADDIEAIPDYRTVFPSTASLVYQVRHGPTSGRADLRWRLAADGYQLDLAIESGGRPLLAQSSRGGFDAAGLAPLRFTDKRLRRPASAANFQREVGRITFSGPATSFPIRPGTQDRLSWLLQIAAIVAAEPTLRVSGARLLMNVVGAHGDAAVWAFVCQAPESGGATGQLVYRRQPHGLYETAAEVWLDPRNGYLPFRAAWKSGASDDGFELTLQDAAPPP